MDALKLAGFWETYFVRPQHRFSIPLQHTGKFPSKLSKNHNQQQYNPT
jgi:hypothetical protein